MKQNNTTNKLGRVILRAGREKPVHQRHPWVFTGAIERVEGPATDGAVVDVCGAQGEFLARGTINRRSQIVVRLLTWDSAEAIDEAFWAGRLARAVDLRRAEVPGGFFPAGWAGRLINAEADGLPGLIVDRYDQWLVLQALTLGMDQRKNQLAAQLMELTHARGVYERSDVDVRQKEGLAEATGLLAGEEPPEWIEIADHAVNGRPLKFLADVRHGQKTGTYLDQAENRRTVARACHGAGEVLNCFAYTGGFTIQALAAGARRVINVDSSADALALARRHLALNDLAVNEEDFVVGNVFEVLRRYREAGRRFDAIILDPPKLAFTSAQVDRAARAYKDLNLTAMQILNPGGLLATFSCSGRVSPDLFQKIVFGAMVDARRDARIIGKLSHAPDHPIALAFPEGEYLKGLLCRVW